MAPTIGLAFLGVFGLIGASIASLGALRLRRWWTMRRLDPTGPFSVEAGLQEFEGRASAVDGTVTAPFTGAEALVCEWQVERYDHDDDGSNWDTVESDESSVPFELEGDGRAVAVDPTNARTLLSDEFEVDTDRDDEIPESVRSYVDDHLGGGDGLDATVEIGPLSIGGRRYRFTEERLDPGETVYVLGPAKRDPSLVPDSDARLAVATGERGWRDRLLGAPFVVADAGEDAAERRQLKSAAGLLAVGLLFAGVPLLFLVA